MSTFLESIEEKALNYLGQVSNPLVRLDVLQAHLTDGDTGEAFGVVDLKNFLSSHDSFRIIEAPSTTGDFLEGLSAESESSTAIFVMLSTRVPTDQQLAVMMLDQLESLHQALNTAMAQAHENSDTVLMKKLGEALQRIDALRKKLTASASEPSAN